MAARPSIKLNGVLLPPQMIAAEAQHHPSRTPAMAYQAAARAIIIRTLLLEEAQREAITAEAELVSPGKRELDDEAKIRVLIEARIPVNEPDEAQCRAFYEADPARFRSPDLYEASHILFLAHPHDTAAYAAATAKAKAVIAELSAAPDRFETIAREQSECDSRANGGRLGQVARGETVPEFEEALRFLAEGTISPSRCRPATGSMFSDWMRAPPEKLCPLNMYRNRSLATWPRRRGAAMLPPISNGSSARHRSRASTCRGRRWKEQGRHDDIGRNSGPVA
jgi:peptidyl-prolyl cis-trans isomerase C